MNSIEVKIIGMVCLGCGTLCVGLLPGWFSNHSLQWPVLLSSLLCFGGGVLLSTSMIHILPELRELTSNAEILFCIGFFVLYAIDEFVHYFCNNQHNHNNNEENHNMRSRSSTAVRSTYGYGTVESSSLLTRSESNIYTRQISKPFIKTLSHDNLYYKQPQQSHICHVSHTEPCNDPPVGQMSLLFALSLHAILEGLAIGLQKSTAKVWLLIGAVASHKLVVSFCLGIELSTGIAKTACRHFTAITIFGFGSIVGIGIGMSITSLSTDWSTTAEPILQGIAGGTLLYVTVCEVLPRERARWHNQSNFPSASLLQFLSVVVGFTLTTLTTRYLEVDHQTP